MTSDDHYALLGVEPTATTEQIREAYRARKETLEQSGTGKGSDARQELAGLNRAWNTLADAYQRGRYDEQLARKSGSSSARSEEGEEYGNESGGEGSPVRRRWFESAFSGGDRPSRRMRSEPTLEYPPGYRPAANRPRILAMVFDVSVLAFLFIGIVFIGGAQIIEKRFPDEIDRIEALRDQIEKVNKRADDAGNRADDSEGAVSAAQSEGDDTAEKKARVDLKKAETEKKNAESRSEELDDELRKVQGKLIPTNLLLVELAFLLSLAYLVIPSVRSGQTWGKKLRRVRVVKTDGSSLGWKGAFVRYGIPLLGANLMYLVLRELAFALVIVLVLGWIRNANLQGIHDRTARTIVVEAA